MFVACGVLLGATVAMAGVPSPGNSTIPPHINLVGFNPGTGLADSGLVATITKVQVIVRDLANNPVAGSTVVFDFSACASSAGKDLKLSDTQHYGLGGPQPLAVVCATKRVTGFTDATGSVNFVIEGGAAVGAAQHSAVCGKIYADNVLLGSVGVGMYNLNDAADVGGADLSQFALDAFSFGTTAEQANYDGATDGSGNVCSGADLSLFAAIVFNGQSAATGAACLP
jgi:hypothetical protein